MDSSQLAVLRKIMYAVETGGQVYGNCRYDDFTEAYTNSSSEHAITIGAGQWYANEARKLLLRIQSADSTLFSSLDTAGIAADLSSDWSSYQLSEGSAKANCIVAIIDTAVGHSCQDALMDEQMAEYVAEAAALGVTSPRAQAMCANFRHHGGYSAMKRIIDKTATPYTLDHLYAACQTDTGNQVGTYTSRQKFVYNALITYMAEDDSYKVIEDAVTWAVGIANDDSHGYDQGSRNGPDYDCSALVCWAYYNAGLNTRPDGSTPSTHSMYSVFTNAGFNDVTSQVDLSSGSGLLRGDVLLQPGSHTAMYIGNGQIVQASINEFGDIVGGQTGDQTGREIWTTSYSNHPWTYVLRYKSGGAGGGSSGLVSLVSWIPG